MRVQDDSEEKERVELGSHPSKSKIKYNEASAISSRAVYEAGRQGTFAMESVSELNWSWHSVVSFKFPSSLQSTSHFDVPFRHD